MGKHKKSLDRRWLITHREWQLQQGIGKLLEGKADPEYVALRGQKYKEAKGG
jgi:hypothetical protein